MMSTVMPSSLLYQVLPQKTNESDRFQLRIFLESKVIEMACQGGRGRTYLETGTWRCWAQLQSDMQPTTY